MQMLMKDFSIYGRLGRRRSQTARRGIELGQPGSSRERLSITAPVLSQVSTFQSFGVAVPANASAQVRGACNKGQSQGARSRAARPSLKRDLSGAAPCR